VGTLIDERYVVEGRVGEGGMGTVYRVRDLRMSRIIALKTVNGMFDQASRAGKRFLREAQVMAAITHPGVVRVFDFGVIDAQVAYLAMELLHGRTLGARLDEAAPLSTEESCSIACQVLATLSVIHNQGFVHRDLKPANVFLSEMGSARLVKLLDFGLSRETRQSAVRLTNPGTVLGTPHYMSPELVRGAEPSSRSDVFSVALLLFEMLTGDLPVVFGDEPWVRTFNKILYAPHRHPHELNPNVPAGLAQLLVDALEGDGRFEHAYDFLMAIDATQSGAYMRSELARSLPAGAPERRG
jgi:eukaryotic-like serine/threonine-protein kinase